MANNKIHIQKAVAGGGGGGGGLDYDQAGFEDGGGDTGSADMPGLAIVAVVVVFPRVHQFPWCLHCFVHLLFTQATISQTGPVHQMRRRRRTEWQGAGSALAFGRGVGYAILLNIRALEPALSTAGQ